MAKRSLGVRNKQGLLKTNQIDRDNDIKEKRAIISIRIRVLKVQIGQIKYENFTSPNNFELDEKLLKA
jgi:hypothetical protein